MKNVDQICLRIFVVKNEYYQICLRFSVVKNEYQICLRFSVVKNEDQICLVLCPNVFYTINYVIPTI